MRVVLVGYGRMGVLIEDVLVQRGHSVVCRVDNQVQADESEVSADKLGGADGIIEFALAPGILDRIKIYAQSGLPAVIGTTGWEDQVDLARKLYRNNSSAILRGSNFSIGAHLFFRLTSAAAKLIDKADEYDVSICEYHHNKKADYPSGTAITAAEGILQSIGRKKYITRDLPGSAPIAPDALHVSAVRVGHTPGIHEMRMDSSADFLTIRHEARNRSGFALGAVRSLEWLKDKKGWHEVYEFVDELLEC